MKWSPHDRYPNGFRRADGCELLWSEAWPTSATQFAPHWGVYGPWLSLDELATGAWIADIDAPKDAPPFEAADRAIAAWASEARARLDAAIAVGGGE